jgi:hypothetical protein
MTSDRLIYLVGQVFVDVYFGRGGYHSRLGGIAHAARALWALGCPYALCYIAPEFLDAHIVEHANKYSAAAIIKIGNVLGAANVLLIREPTESGNQGYYEPLFAYRACSIDSAKIKNSVSVDQITDILIFPGGFDLSDVLKAIAAAGSKA